MKRNHPHRLTQPEHEAETGPECAGLDMRLNAYLDGELPRAQQQALELQLVTDRTTRSQLDDLAQIQAMLRLAYGTMPIK